MFFAEIDTTGPRGRRVLPCRPSDAIALALRQRLPTPILVAEWVFSGPTAAEGAANGAGCAECLTSTAPDTSAGGRRTPHPDPVLQRPATADRSHGGWHHAWAVAWSATMARSPSSEMRISSAMST